MIYTLHERMNAGALKTVGRSGQISLGKRHAGRTLLVEDRPDGTIVLTPVTTVPDSQLWTLQEPHRSRIERGLSYVSAHPPRETDLDALERRALKPPRRRGRR